MLRVCRTDISNFELNPSGFRTAANGRKIRAFANMTRDGDESKSEIQQFFDGTNVFVTGATGFIGHVLVEKLLRYVCVYRHITTITCMFNFIRSPLTLFTVLAKIKTVRQTFRSVFQLDELDRLRSTHRRRTFSTETRVGHLQWRIYQRARVGRSL